MLYVAAEVPVAAFVDADLVQWSDATAATVRAPYSLPFANGPPDTLPV